ncbi:hypothetical protein [Cryobacterium zhongshanensis]|uniref:Uncharacterized protein n=1 Tax=Cryobacterium zhongshanensis TaxID=2928153 RepID=A0AA41QY66_9MICO|nr:hypothetical protein [Cryobacterium zhongshanensis]MCI4659700.1 hypothetical protein [Cryobacterium zhongshanensis]
MSTSLTPYDTGEILEPKVHGGTTGQVDFENEESSTMITVSARPTRGQDGVTVTIDTQTDDLVTVVINGDGHTEPISNRLAALIAALDARGVDGESIAMNYLVDVAAPDAGIEYDEATGAWQLVKASCIECGEGIAADDVHAGDGLCGSCVHNERRSG